jgi:hypothetical protein
MKSVTSRLLAAAIIAGLAVIGSMMNSTKVSAQQGPPNGLAVNIVSPMPVPVTGSTTVSGSVAATQSGPWNVGITGAPTVSVSNTAAGPLFVRNRYEPGENPYQATLSVDALHGCSSTGCVTAFGTVPSGKRLVIKNITGAVFVTSPGVLVPPQLCVGGSFDPNNLTGPQTGCTQILRIPTSLQSGVFDGQNMIGINAALDDYVEENNALFFLFQPSGGTIGSTRSIVTLSGFLVDK